LAPLSGSGGGVIFFTSARDGNLEIYVMDADGTSVQRLTNNRADGFNAVWQPLPESPPY
jgi:Tol biopolymer transport system component